MNNSPDTELEKQLQKIVNETEIVKSLTLSAKNDVLSYNFEAAQAKINQAEQASSCSFCKNKLFTISSDLNSIKQILSKTGKIDHPHTEFVISQIDSFYAKLPSVEEIRKTKAMNTIAKDGDPLAGLWQALNAPFIAMGQFNESIWKIRLW